jgi:dual specificity tyrosine-phosphorylation-regulated kinase 2/3/4
MLSLDLYQYIKLTKFQGVPLPIIKKLSVQILQALRLTDRYKIIHCDLKPENILLKSVSGTDLKVIDFGSACFYEKRMYTYIQSRFYRAPEIMLGLSYTTAIDMWSFGCILVELLTGRPIFPGENEAEQMQCIMEVLGLPPQALLERGSRVKLFFDDEFRPKLAPNSKGKKRYPATKELREIMHAAENGLYDLVLQCLEWDSNRRITPDEALLHDWLQEGEGGRATKRRLKHQRTTSDTSFLKIPQRFDKLRNYIEGPANL